MLDTILNTIGHVAAWFILITLTVFIYQSVFDHERGKYSRIANHFGAGVVTFAWLWAILWMVSHNG